jgi:probable F420-dependent oxidoreductase
MRLGLALPHYDFSFPDGRPLSWERLAATAARAEALGFDSLWVSDHFFLSLTRYGGPPGPYGAAEPLTTLAGLAAVTDRARLGTLVLGAGFRHPATVAKSAVTIDLASEGRLELGLGAGWYEDEYRAFGYPFEPVGSRFELLEETVEILARLFGPGEPVTWQGKHFRLRDAYCRPRPFRSTGPPLWIGGKGGPRLMRLIAERGDGWNAVWAWTPEAYRERLSVLERACSRAGRDPATVRRSVGLYTVVGEDPDDLAARWKRILEWVPGDAMAGADLSEWGADKLAGTPEEVLQRLEAFAALGVEETILSIGPLPFAVGDDEMLDLIGEGVLPAARDL